MKKRAGFTLIELMVVIAIIAIMAAVGFVSFTNAQVSGRDGRRKQDIRLLGTALDLYYQINHRYPTTDWAGDWQHSTSGGSWLKDFGDPTTGVVANFDSTYIQSQPLDPINNSLFLYQYYTNISWGPNSCVPGQYYILYANLENHNDPDSNSNKHYTWCGMAAGPANGVGDYSFVVTPTP